MQQILQHYYSKIFNILLQVPIRKEKIELIIKLWKNLLSKV